MMMDIRVYRMKSGETRTFLREGEETAVLLLSGNITYKWNGNEAAATRKDVFTEDHGVFTDAQELRLQL